MCHEHCPAPIRGGAGIVEERVETPGAGRTVPGFLARPEEGSAPAILILHDIWGSNDFYHDLARRLASEGFVALLLDLFVRLDPLSEVTREAARARGGQLDQTAALTDIAGAITWLREHPASNGQVGTIGFCMGGTLAMLAAADDPVPDASVSFYGFPGTPATPLRPRVPLGEANQLRSPLLAIWGDQDAGVGMDTVEAYRAALAEADRQFEVIVYPGPGHAFMTFDPGAQWYDEAQDAWSRTLAFLRDELAA